MMTATFLILAAIAVAGSAAAMSLRNAVHCVLLAGMILVIPAQSQIAKEHLVMEAKIESKRYCKVNSTKASLEIQFRVALKNTTRETITMEQPLGVVLFVSHTLQDLQHGKYQMMLYAPDVFFRVKPGDKAPTTEPASPQAEVKPGEIFTGETTEERPIPIALNGKFPRWEALEPGRYFVLLMSDGVIQGTDDFVKITSQPIEIIVDTHPKVEKCP